MGVSSVKRGVSIDGAYIYIYIYIYILKVSWHIIPLDILFYFIFEIDGMGCDRII